ncbi:MAG: hypothetical protein ACKVT0_14690 [Planctomycetaceae bacterium]
MPTMASKPVQGTILQVEISSVFTTIPGLTNIKSADFDVGERDTTDLESTYMEREPTLLTIGHVTAEGKLNHSNVVHRQLIADMAAVPATVRNYKIIHPDTKEDTFAAWPSYSPQGKTPGGDRRANWTFKVKGAYVTPTS